MKEKFLQWRDSAVHEALMAKAYLTALIHKHETTHEERARIADEPKIKKLFLEVGTSLRGLYFRVLEGRLASRLKEARLSGDFTELMESGEDITTGKVETLWQKIRVKVKPSETAKEWQESQVMPDRVRKHPDFSESAKEYAVKYLRYLFFRKLNGEAINEKDSENEVKNSVEE